MGFRICYLAAKIAPREMARAFGFEITHKNNDEMPDGEWWVARLAESGWSILWAEEEDFGARSRDLVSALSQQTGVFHCDVNETVMWSSADYWSNGALLWRITHTGCDGDVYDLKTEGALPKEFETIRDKYFAMQKAEDSEDEFPCDHVFDVPLEVANAIIDFRHDQELDPKDVGNFYILKPATRPSFWSRLFGGR